MSPRPTAYRTKVSGRVDRLEPLDPDLEESVAFVAFGVIKADDLKSDRAADVTRVISVKLDDFVALRRDLADELVAAMRRHGTARTLAELGLEPIPNADHAAGEPPILDLGPTPAEVIDAAILAEHADYALVWARAAVAPLDFDVLAETIDAIDSHPYRPHELRRFLEAEELAAAAEDRFIRGALVDLVEERHAAAADALAEEVPPVPRWSVLSARDTLAYLTRTKAEEEARGTWPALAEHAYRYEARHRASSKLLSGILELAPELAEELAGAPGACSACGAHAALLGTPPRCHACIAANRKPITATEKAAAVLPRGDFAPALPGEEVGA